MTAAFLTAGSPDWAAGQTPAPAPPAVSSIPQTGPLSGYMDFHFNKRTGEDGVLDFHRFVLLVTHRFTPRIRFVGELELEHAVVEGLEEAGELELEQAYLDFLITREFNVRAGMVLVPLGIINERHEPPVFHGVERPLVDTVIIPTTWFDAGAGVHGELAGGWRYRAYVLTPLNALEFSAAEGIRGGQQKGSEAAMRNAAVAGRFEYLGLRGLSAGAGFWTGQGNVPGSTLATPVRLFEIDARYTVKRLDFRAQAATVSITNAGALNAALGRLTGIDPNIASGLRGVYGEAAYRVWAGGSARDLAAFVRYENFDTQHRMPQGWLPLKQFDRDAWVTGLTYFPDPDIAVKLDYVHLRNQSGVVQSPSSFNVGLGWWF
jgi:hypothetical protein